MRWENVLPEVWRFRDSCNVYAVRGPRGLLVIDAGTGAWLDRVGELGPVGDITLACTHYFRDHSAGAADAARRGVAVYVPELERDLFADPEQHFRQRESYIVYQNVWDFYAPIRGVPVAGVLQDYERLTLAGFDVEVVPLPGATVTQIGLAVRLEDDTLALFCGEAIHSPGRLPRVAPLQYNYNDMTGIAWCYTTAMDVIELKPDALLPSLGEPMIGAASCVEALRSLRTAIRDFTAHRPGMSAYLDATLNEPLRRVTDHVWRDMNAFCTNWFILSKSGKALTIDYGYHRFHGFPNHPQPHARRALLHGVQALKKQFGIDRVDVALISHFHDDHVAGVGLLRRLFGTRCWAAENFADLLEHPEAHAFPCNWPIPTRVDRRLPLDQEVQWEEYTFRFHPMSGHTRFASLIGFEADGKRFAHTGDQYFFDAGWFPQAEPLTDFARLTPFPNHVYRNGALLDGFEISGKWMLEWRPEIVLQGHQAPFITNEDFFKHIAAWGPDIRERHRKIMPLEDDGAHFNMDSWGGWIWPYRTHLEAPGKAVVRVTVRNPLPVPAMLNVRLVGPEGWRGSSASIPAGGREEASCELSITPTGEYRRQPFAAELTVDGQPYGQIAEALMTVGGVEF